MLRNVGTGEVYRNSLKGERWSMSEVINQEEARRRLGEDVVIGLEPKNEWVFDIEKGAIRRLDGRFHDGRVIQHPGG